MLLRAACLVSARFGRFTHEGSPANHRVDRFVVSIWQVIPGALPVCAHDHPRDFNAGAGRQVLDALVAEGGDPAAIVEREGLGSIGGGDELAGIVAAAIAANGDAAEKVRGGNAKAMGPIVGFVMRETKGRADGGEVTRIVREQLGL